MPPTITSGKTRCILVQAIICSLVIAVNGQGLSAKRPITVSDAIRMRRAADPDNDQASDWRARYAHFSPDGVRFVIVVKKGNLEKNTNEFSLVGFRTADAFNSPKADVLLTMSSSSNRSRRWCFRAEGAISTAIIVSRNYEALTWRGTAIHRASRRSGRLRRPAGPERNCPLEVR